MGFWGDGFGEVHRAGELTIAVAPVVLNTLDVPLVNKDDDLLSGILVNQSEKILIALVNEYFLQSWEEDLCTLDVPIKLLGIKTLLCESLGVRLMDLLTVGQELLSVEALGILNAFEEVVWHVHPGLVVDAINGNTVQLRP